MLFSQLKLTQRHAALSNIVILSPIHRHIQVVCFDFIIGEQQTDMKIIYSSKC